MLQSLSANNRNGGESGRSSPTLSQQEAELPKRVESTTQRYLLRNTRLEPVADFVPLRSTFTQQVQAEATPGTSQGIGVYSPMKNLNSYSPVDDPEALFRTVRKHRRNTEAINETLYEVDERLETVVKRTASSKGDLFSPGMQSVSHVSGLKAPGMEELTTPIEYEDHNEELEELRGALRQTKDRLERSISLGETAAEGESGFDANTELKNCYQDMKNLMEISMDLKSQLANLKQRYTKIAIRRGLDTQSAYLERDRVIAHLGAARDTIKYLEVQLEKSRDVNNKLDEERKVFHEEAAALSRKVQQAQRIYEVKLERALAEREKELELKHEDELRLKAKELQWWKSEFQTMQKWAADSHNEQIIGEQQRTAWQTKYNNLNKEFEELRGTARSYSNGRQPMTSSPSITEVPRTSMPRGLPKENDTAEAIRALASALSNNHNKRPTGENILITPNKFDGVNGQNVEDFFEDLDKYIIHGGYEEGSRVDVLRKFLEGSVLTQFMDQRRAHKSMTYWDAKTFLMQRYHTVPSKTVVASELRQITYKENEDFDKYYDKVMLLLDRLQPDMPQDVRAGYLLTGITSAGLREKLCNFKMNTPEELRNAVLTVLHNMHEVRRLKEAEKGVRYVVKEAEASPCNVVVDEKAWVNRFNDPVCADCGEVGHTRRQWGSSAKLDKVYAKPPEWLLKLVNQIRHPKPPQYNNNNNNNQGMARAATEVEEPDEAKN